jgi:hypothetical protein
MWSGRLGQASVASKGSELAAALAGRVVGARQGLAGPSGVQSQFACPVAHGSVPIHSNLITKYSGKPAGTVGSGGVAPSPGGSGAAGSSGLHFSTKQMSLSVQFAGTACLILLLKSCTAPVVLL